mmetsp:Transcript_119111/g.336934  ORF Transcript_119111/g.336934 Transcript_119111/m.336934 type:complete len:300 (+) Transcript_119111:513-1412(+)
MLDRGRRARQDVVAGQSRAQRMWRRARGLGRRRCVHHWWRRRRRWQSMSWCLSRRQSCTQKWRRCLVAMGKVGMRTARTRMQSPRAQPLLGSGIHVSGNRLSPPSWMLVRGRSAWSGARCPSAGVETATSFPRKSLLGIRTAVRAMAPQPIGRPCVLEILSASTRTQKQGPETSTSGSSSIRSALCWAAVRRGSTSLSPRRWAIVAKHARAGFCIACVTRGCATRWRLNYLVGDCCECFGTPCAGHLPSRARSCSSGRSGGAARAEALGPKRHLILNAMMSALSSKYHPVSTSVDLLRK